MSGSNFASPVGMRAAVVGLGRMGLRHVEALRRLGIDVCAMSDRSPEALETAARDFSIDARNCFSDAHEMLETARPEALVIATTAPAHAELTVAAAQKGVKRILCEKPMANSIAECDDMISACRRAGAELAINHQMRFMPRYTEVKALLGGEELGSLSSIVVAGSNFGLAMNASHYFETFRFISDSPVHSVQAWFDDAQVPNPRGPEFVDRAGRLVVRSEAGLTMFIDFASGAGHGLQVVYICRNGQIVVDELRGEIRISARKAEYRDLPTTRYGMPADVRTIAVPPADTVVPTMAVWQAMLSGGSYPDGDAGLHALTCLVAAHASHEAGGKEVRLDSMDLPRDRRFPWA